MRKLAISLLIIIALIVLQIFIYALFLKQTTSTWGASSKEVSASMPGDDLSDQYQSTRAITINANQADTWAWLNQMGADRGGFFSHYFIEQFLGYQTRPQAIVEPKFPDFVPGDVIRGSITPSQSIIIYEFPIVETKAESHLVAKNWGTFQLNPISETQTRLIIRTHRPVSDSFVKNAFDYYISEGLHFVMERATLTGFKARVETGPGPVFDDTIDRLWFLGILTSAIAIAILIFLLQGISAIVIPVLLSTGWTLILLLADPVPIYSLTFLALGSGVILYQVYMRKKTDRDVTRD